MSASQHVTFRIWRGDASGGEFRDYPTEVSEGMVVLDAVLEIRTIHEHLLIRRLVVGDRFQRDMRHGLVTKPASHAFLWMRQLLEYGQEVRDPQEFMQNLRK